MFFYYNSMAQEKKKIGLLLASIHAGISPNIWDSFAEAAEAEHIALFIFPGGRLNVRQDDEYLRNRVYFLANDENLDGCISLCAESRVSEGHLATVHLPNAELSAKSLKVILRNMRRSIADSGGEGEGGV